MCMIYSFCNNFIPESEFTTQMKFTIYLKIIFFVTRCSLANYRPCESNSTVVNIDCDHRVSEYYLQRWTYETSDSTVLSIPHNTSKHDQYLVRPKLAFFRNLFPEKSIRDSGRELGNYNPISTKSRLSMLHWTWSLWNGFCWWKNLWRFTLFWKFCGRKDM